MWYHYLILLVALYFAATGAYGFVKNPKTTYYIATGVIQVVVALYVVYWAYSVITAPPPFMIPTVGGGRRRY
jgi:hypothetical protein